MKEGRLSYNPETGRYGFLVSDLWERTGLHCGECLQVMIDGEWVETRMEMGGQPADWYLVGTSYSGAGIEYIRARM